MTDALPGTLGRHVLVELYGCAPDRLDDAEVVAQEMLAAAREAGATVISSAFHAFSPFGVSGVVVIQESHLTIHTWPEYGYAAVDLFTCGHGVDPWVSYRSLKRGLGAAHGSATELHRGAVELLQRVAVGGPPRTTRPPPPVARDLWFTDRRDDIAVSLRHAGARRFRQRSAHQLVEVYDTAAYGLVLTLDGRIVCAERHESAYHELLAHIGALGHPSPRCALVIGGGDGGLARELLRHPEIERVDVVEVDPVVVEASRAHLPALSASLDDPRVRLHIEDGAAFAARAPDAAYDLVFVDVPAQDGASDALVGGPFHAQVFRLLREPGVLVAPCPGPRRHSEAFLRLLALRRACFDEVRIFSCFASTFPAGSWRFAFCSRGHLAPEAGPDPERAARLLAGHALQHYNPAVHAAAFALPTFLAALVG